MLVVVVLWCLAGRVCPDAPFDGGFDGGFDDQTAGFDGEPPPPTDGFDGDDYGHVRCATAPQHRRVPPQQEADSTYP